MPGHDGEPIQAELRLLGELEILRNDLYDIQYRRLRWVHHIREELVRDLRETESGFTKWLSRAESILAKLTSPGLADAAEELRALTADQIDYDPAKFSVTIPIPEEGSLCFQVCGTSTAEPPGSARPAQRQSARLAASANEAGDRPHADGLGTDYPTAGSLALSEAARRRLWITSTPSGCVCIECPCPATVAPCGDSTATHNPIPRNFHHPPFEYNHAKTHFHTVHKQQLTASEMLGKYGKTGMSLLPLRGLHH